jgi:hypothetical protein
MATHCGVDGPATASSSPPDKLDKIGARRDELREAGYDEGAIGKLFDLALSAEDGPADARLERLARLRPAAADAAEGLRTIVRAVAREAGDGTTCSSTRAWCAGLLHGSDLRSLYGAGIVGDRRGGRYDRMVGRLLGHDTGGFSIGFEGCRSSRSERGARAPSVTGSPSSSIATIR